MRSTHYRCRSKLLLIANINIESLCSMKICESICRETFHAVYYFLLFLAWVKKILPIFHFTMLAGLQLCTLPPCPQEGWTCSHDLHHRVVRLLHSSHATGLHWRDGATESWHFESAVSHFRMKKGGMSIVRQATTVCALPPSPACRAAPPIWLSSPQGQFHDTFFALNDSAIGTYTAGASEEHPLTA